MLPELQRQLPPSIQISIRQDRSKNIRKAFGDIQLTMLVTLVLVVGVIFLFLHNGSATLIPALALPFSILGTFAVMTVMNFSLDNLSMMALILSIGFVVDDAIVMLENIVRHMENGEGPLEASLNGSKEIGFTILTMTTSLAAVFIPILFMGGILGRLFREFAVTITTAILISGIVSVTLTPMLCSRFLRVVHAKKGLVGYMERAFDWLRGGYEWSLGLVLRHRLAMLALFAVVLFATVADVRHRAEGIHSGYRQRLVEHPAARGPGHVVLRDGHVRAADRGPRRTEPQCRRGHGQHGRQRGGDERRPVQRAADPARQPAAVCNADRPATEGATWGASRDSAPSSPCRPPSRLAAR